MDATEITLTARPPGSGGGLLRVLGFSFALAVGVGSVIGSGILRTPASVADAVGSVEIALLLWVAVAVHSFIQANVIAEVMAALPKAGGLFVPARAAFGEPGGLLVGWVDWLSFVAVIAALSITTAEFLGTFVPIVGAHPGIAGALIAVPFFLLNWLGVREGSVAQIVGSLAKFAFLLGIAALILLSPPQSSAAAPAASPAPIRSWALWLAISSFSERIRAGSFPLISPARIRTLGGTSRALFSLV